MSTTDRYAKMSQEDFDRILTDIVGGLTGPGVLAVAGVYEAMSEHFNNDVLEVWERENPEEDEDAPRVGDLVFDPRWNRVSLPSPWGTVESVNHQEGIQTWNVTVNGDEVSIEYGDSAWYLTDDCAAMYDDGDGESNDTA